MSTVFRKKPTSVIRTTLSKPNNPIDWLILIKPIILFICLIFGYILYANWTNILDSLDKTPIKSYALTHKTRFTTNTDIREVLSKEPQLKGYFGQDIQEIKERFLALSWIQDVVVRKVYPNRLSLTLIEHIPAAHWNQRQFVSAKGIVFELPAGRFEGQGLPVLFGPDSESKVVLEAWGKIKQDLETRNLRLKAVAMDTRGSWTITLDNNVELRLGRGDWLPKIDRFVSIFPEIDVPEGKRLSYVDLRYEHGVSVGLSNKN